MVTADRRQRAPLTIRRGHVLLHVNDPSMLQDSLQQLDAFSPQAALATSDQNSQLVTNAALQLQQKISKSIGVHAPTFRDAIWHLRKSRWAQGKEADSLLKKLSTLNTVASFLRHFSEPWLGAVQKELAQLFFDADLDSPGDDKGNDSQGAHPGLDPPVINEDASPQTLPEYSNAAPTSPVLEREAAVAALESRISKLEVQAQTTTPASNFDADMLQKIQSFVSSQVESVYKNFEIRAQETKNELLAAAPNRKQADEGGDGLTQCVLSDIHALAGRAEAIDLNVRQEVERLTSAVNAVKNEIATFKQTRTDESRHILGTDGDHQNAAFCYWCSRGECWKHARPLSTARTSSHSAAPVAPSGINSNDPTSVPNVAGPIDEDLCRYRGNRKSEADDDDKRHEDYLAHAGGFKQHNLLGKVITVHGLQNAVDLNGKVGIVKAFDRDSNRYKVCVAGRADLVKIKEDNLRAVVRDAAMETAFAKVSEASVHQGVRGVDSALVNTYAEKRNIPTYEAARALWHHLPLLYRVQLRRAALEADVASKVAKGKDSGAVQKRMILLDEFQEKYLR